MKKKIVGSLAVFLIILLAFTPMVYGTPLKVREISQHLENLKKSKEMGCDKIDSVFELHKDYIEEINQHVNDLITEYGYIDWNFALPDKLQGKFNVIVEDLGIEPEKIVWEKNQLYQHPIFTKFSSRLIQRFYLLLDCLSFKNIHTLICGTCSTSPSNTCRPVVNNVKNSSVELYISNISTDNEYVESETSYSTLSWDLEMLDIWLSTKKADIYKEHSIPTADLGQKVWFHFMFRIHGSGTVPPYGVELRLDESVYCGAYDVDYTEGGKTYVFYCTTGWVATSGKHTIEGEIDVFNQVPEYNEDNNLLSYQFTVEGGDDGITKLDIILYKMDLSFVTVLLGIEVNLWMSHSYIVNNLNPGVGLGIVGITLLLIALGFKTMGLAWIFAAWIIGGGINDINNKDHGRGVYIEFSIGLIGPGWPPKISPQ